MSRKFGGEFSVNLSPVLRSTIRSPTFRKSPGLGFAFAAVALNLHRAAVPIEFCYRVPASPMRYRAISTGVNSGLPSPIDRDCRVMIAAYYCAALTAFVYTNGKRHLLPVAAVAAYLTRVLWIYSLKRPASVLSFAFRYREKAPPAHVADCLGETAILDHPANVQIFDRDRVKSSDQVGRDLVVKILTTARHFQMRLGHFDSLLRATLRSLLSA